MFLLAAAKGAIEVAAERTLPTLFNESRVIRGEPLVRVAELLAVFIGGNCRNRGNARGGAARFGLFPFDDLKFIHKLGVADDRVNRRQRKVFMFRGKLGEKIIVSRVEAAEKKHDP